MLHNCAEDDLCRLGRCDMVIYVVGHAYARRLHGPFGQMRIPRGRLHLGATMAEVRRVNKWNKRRDYDGTRRR